jgi:hypothetical protein
MQIGLLEILKMWNFPFMKMNEWLDKCNAILLSITAYHNLTPNSKSYEEDSPWNRKEMKQISRYLLVVVTQCLQGGSTAQSLIFNLAIECTWALWEFYLYA